MLVIHEIVERLQGRNWKMGILKKNRATLNIYHHHKKQSEFEFSVSYYIKLKIKKT